MGRRSIRIIGWSGLGSDAVPSRSTDAEFLPPGRTKIVPQRRQCRDNRRCRTGRPSRRATFRCLQEPPYRPQIHVSTCDRKHTVRRCDLPTFFTCGEPAVNRPQLQAIQQQTAQFRIRHRRAPVNISSATLRCCHLPSLRLPLNSPFSTTTLPRRTVRHGHASILRPSHGV